jgi:HD-like signal output (HDOD) protein
MTLQDWLDRLGPAPLPAFAHTLEELAGLRRRGEALATSQLAQIILFDPLLTLRVLNAANDRGRHEPNVCTVEHALMMSGVQAFLDGLSGIASVENTALGRDPRALADVYAQLRTAQHAAWQARDFAVLHKDIRAEEVQVAALLHHAPLFLLWLKAPETARKLRRLYRKLDAEAAETEALGLPLQTLRLALLEAWRLPDLTRDLLDSRQAERARHTLLRASLEIAEHCQRGWWAPELLGDLERLAGVVNMPLEQVIATAHGNAVRVARRGHWMPAPAAAAWLVMEPGEWPPEPDEEEEAAIPAPSQPAETAPAPAPRHPVSPPPAPSPPPPAAPKPVTAPVAAAAPVVAEEAPHVCPMPNKSAFQESLKGIEGHLDHSLNINQMSAIILKGLHSGLGLSRIVFAMATPDGRRVKGRFTLGVPVDDPLRHFEFELEGKDLFAQLMKKMQGVWINEENRERLWPMVSPKLQGMIGAADFFAMSLLSGTRPLGLIYADRGHGECGLDPLTYTDFKMLCLQAARGLSQIKG